LWWCRLHRVHHRFTDTDLDPYNAARGFWFSHIGWLLFYPRYQLGRVDVSDLRRNSVVMWQRRYYYVIVPIVSIVIPSLIPQYCWGESIHGSIIGTSLRMVGSHHVSI
jgi:stearoyl-CoA desaturase (delta-9 desaturase)